jgi:hypothetical protein
MMERRFHIEGRSKGALQTPEMFPICSRSEQYPQDWNYGMMQSAPLRRRLDAICTRYDSCKLQLIKRPFGHL